MKKSNKKITKKDLEAFTPDRVINDLNLVNSIVNKMSDLDESLTEKDAEKLKTELVQIESYLKDQFSAQRIVLILAATILNPPVFY